MIITDRNILEQVSRYTTYKECVETGVFNLLMEALQSSKEPGLGLSAIQIGIPIRAAIITTACGSNECKHTKHIYRTINPEIIRAQDAILWTGEGCLSDPGKRYNTMRYNEVEVWWEDFDSTKDPEFPVKHSHVFKALDAVVWQHEIDHTLGICNYKREFIKPQKLGRNDPCTCGSGKKFKKCHGA